MFTGPQIASLKSIFKIDELTQRIEELEAEVAKPRLENLATAGEIRQGKLYKANNLDAGQDIFSNEDVVIEANSGKLISTNLYIAVPDNHVGLIWSRSGLSVKHKIEVGAGCIDIGYRGEVKVHLYNFSNTPYKVNTGDKIAQLLTIPINLLEYKQVEEFTIVESERNEKGFGSSGV